MQAELNSFVATPGLATLATLVTASSAAVESIRTAPDPVRRATELSHAIEDALERLRPMLVTSPAGGSVAAVRIGIEVLELRLSAIDLARSGIIDGRAALMANAQSWGVHFSNIRLGLTTFLVSVSWGIVAAKWGEFDPALRTASLVAWSFAILLYAAFTYKTFAKESIELSGIRFLKAGVVPARRGTNWLWFSSVSLVGAVVAAWVIACSHPCWCAWKAPLIGGVAIAVVGWTLAITCQAADPKERRGRVGRLIPDVVLVAASLAFGMLLSVWPSRQMSHVISVPGIEGAITVRAVSQSRASAEATKTDALADRLGQIATVFAKVAARQQAGQANSEEIRTSLGRCERLLEEMAANPTAAQVERLQAELEALSGLVNRCEACGR